MFGAMLCGISAGVLAFAAGLGILVGLALYSGVGSLALLILALTLPDRRPELSRSGRRPAFA
jgi:hypothetical protein